MSMHPQRRQRGRALQQVRAGGNVSTNDFKNGVMVEIDNTPFKVVGAHCTLTLE